MAHPLVRRHVRVNELDHLIRGQLTARYDDGFGHFPTFVIAHRNDSDVRDSRVRQQ